MYTYIHVALHLYYLLVCGVEFGMYLRTSVSLYLYQTNINYNAVTQYSVENYIQDSDMLVATQCHTATPNNTNSLSSEELSSITFLTWSHL